MKRFFLSLMPIAFIALALPAAPVGAADKPFPTRVYTLDGSSSEGFAIGKGPTAYNSSPDGSIYKVDLQSGQGEVLVEVQDPFDCFKLGMRIDDRTNYLFVAGCVYGNAFVYDADRPLPRMRSILPIPSGRSCTDCRCPRMAEFHSMPAQLLKFRCRMSSSIAILSVAPGTGSCPRRTARP
jgi:hypothetical protein